MMDSEPGTKNRPIERALEKYAVVLPYLAYENTTFWTRSGFFLVVHAGLLAFVATSGLPTRASLPDKMILSIAIAVIGIVIGVAWLLALFAGNYWIDRWHAVLVKLEPDAFEDLSILRGKVPNQETRALLPHIGSKFIVYFVAGVFTVLWVALLFWSLSPCI